MKQSRYMCVNRFTMERDIVFNSTEIVVFLVTRMRRVCNTVLAFHQLAGWFVLLLSEIIGTLLNQLKKWAEMIDTAEIKCKVNSCTRRNILRSLRS